MGAPAPALIPEAFATAAAGPNINFPIPDLPPGSPANAVSWHLGFAAVTMEPKVSGGLPPFGQDFNGVLYTLSTHVFALQAGQPYLFNSGVASSVAGYEAGALLGMLDGSGLWLNDSAGNTTDPDNDSTAAGWVSGLSYGVGTVGGATGGTVTVPPSQSRREFLVISGTLASNLTVVLPNNIQSWLIVNDTTGAFSTTIKTAAGTGVVVAQGGPSQPVGVWGDGTNIYPVVAPLAVSISQADTPLTLSERDNTGSLFAYYFNQASNLEDPTIGAVFVQNTAADGYLRKISLANFLTQIASGGVSGNKGWAQIGAVIIQWGPVPAESDSAYHAIVFNGGGGIAFPNACFGVVLSPIQSSQNTAISNAGTTTLAAEGVTKTGFNYIMSANWNIGVVGVPAFYIAIGN